MLAFITLKPWVGGLSHRKQGLPLFSREEKYRKLSRNNFHISRGAARLPLPAKAQTVWPLGEAGSVLKCGNYLKTNGTDLRVKALPYVGVKAFPRFEPQSTQRAQRKTKALLSALCVLCGSNSNLSTCINPDLYGVFKLKSVPLI